MTKERQILLAEFRIKTNKQFLIDNREQLDLETIKTLEIVIRNEEEYLNRITK